MLERTIEFIEQNKLFSNSDRLLLAVSGGIDSMVMLDLFTRLPYTFSVAHCNFSLRGKESDGDQELVESFCSARGINILTRRFATEKYAEENGISVQMAARDLRYTWFEEQRKKLKYNSIVLAHNKDDIIETFFINLSRGTGIKGLTGIKPLKENISRPLLFASRKEICDYADKKNVLYREDSSNIETKYKRNAIRHKIIPLFKELNPSFQETMEGTIKRLADAASLVSDLLAVTREKIFSEDSEGIKAEIKYLAELQPQDIYLYELFKDYGIGQAGIDELKKLIIADPGKYLETGIYRIIKDRSYLIITKKDEQGVREEIFDRPENIKTHSALVLPAGEVKISPDPQVAYLDYDSITFPITIRSWKEGDWFQPLGMKGKKKLSDFFIDQKIPVSQKNKISIFVTGENIFWVCGYRIDRRFAVTENTRRVLVLSPVG